MDELQTLVAQFAKEVVLQDMAETADQGNPHAKRQLHAFDTLVQKWGDEGREALCVLLEHEDPRVRVMAAAFLLRYKHQRAMEVLEEACQGRGLPALAAKCSMENWRRGVWELDLDSSSREST